MNLAWSAIGKNVNKVKTWSPLKSEEVVSFKYIDLGSLDKDKKEIQLNLVQEVLSSKAPSRAKQLVKAGDILVSTVRPNLNGIAVVPSELDGATASTGFCVLRANDVTLNSNYLRYWVESTLFVSEMVNKSTGANYPAVSDKIIKESELPLPPLKNQKQIAAVLEKADQLRKDCQQMEQELNNLAQSVFIDMFGDPVTNPKGWEMKALSELASIVTGNTPSRAKPEYYGSDIEWIKSGNINTPLDYLTVAEEYLSEDGKKAGRVVQSGSVLMTCIAGSPDCIGNIAIADREVAFNQQINALVPMDKKLDTEFLYVLLKVAKKIIQSASTNSMKGMISKSKLESIQLPFPSYAEQCDFSTIYKKLQKEVKKQNEQVVETELMFDALMQKAFKGELNL
ncbi:restriction endonuclease subunit S [Vibrio splendidus]|uniref:restriction endonuclease subunit S n=1 Tax=Vibrio splendidus TaxID=29497 RepID=UPI000D39EEBF|nr:restriction endonuclease subunit S [Vibrio splendidus]PTP08502.1 restriction endonuclease subunit S [Vibrio splendidus]